MKKIFLTGVESFIGQEFLAQCKAAGIETHGVDAMKPSDPSYHQADIRDPGIADLIPEGTDTIVHMAALSRDQDCRMNSCRTFDVNVQGTLNLMDQAKARGVKQFVFASTEWVYDTFAEGVEKHEDDPIDAAKLTSEYAFSKYVSEVNLRQQQQYGFCDTTILRFGIIYGPRKANWSAVESLLNSVATKDEVSVGSLRTGRRFLHVQDIARAVKLSLGLPGFNVINIQGDRLVNLGEIIDLSRKLTGKNPKVAETNPDKPSIRLVSNQRAKDLLGFTPEIDIETGLKSVMAHLNIPLA